MLQKCDIEHVILAIRVKKGRKTMKKVLLTVMSVNYWKNQEKSFVIAMIMMGLFNLSIVGVMLYR